jgi:hypothetical protein
VRPQAVYRAAARGQPARAESGSVSWGALPDLPGNVPSDVPKLITKSGESCAALIGADRLEYYHRLERERIHLTLLEEAEKGLEDAAAGRTLTARQLRARYGR